MQHRPPRLRRRIILSSIAAAGVLAAGALTGIASGHGGSPGIHPYSAGIAGVLPSTGTPATAWAGSTSTVSISITNNHRRERLGSANITIPAGLVVASSTDPVAGGVIQLRNLNLSPGATRVTAATVRIPCVTEGTAYSWAIQARENNNFTGDVFTLTTPVPAVTSAGRCSLGFGGQPANAERTQTISSEAWNPAGSPVTVSVLDGGGTPVAWWSAPVTLSIDPASVVPGSTPGLAGTTSAVPVNGVAGFTPAIDVSQNDYRLSAATDPVVTGATSAEFDIVDGYKKCTGTSCDVSASNNGVQASLASANALPGDQLFLNIGAAGDAAFECDGYTSQSAVVSFDMTSSGTTTKSLTFTVANPTGGEELCYAAPAAFVVKPGTAPIQAFEVEPGVSWYKGLLPSCTVTTWVFVRSRHHHHWHHGHRGYWKAVTVTNPPPCVRRDTTTSPGNLLLTVDAPAGDPKTRY